MRDNFYKSFILGLLIGIITSLLCYYTLNRFIVVYANTHSNSINSKLETMQESIDDINKNTRSNIINTKLESMQKTIDNMNAKTISINDWVDLTKKEGLIINCE